MFFRGDDGCTDKTVTAVQYNLFDWQSLQPFTGAGSMFYDFCDALEVKDGVNAPATGWGLENAIYSWGSFWNTTYYAYGKSNKLIGTLTNSDITL